MPQTKVRKVDIAWDAWEKTLPVVEYPPEVVARWDKELEITRAQIASGEIRPKTAAEMAAERGIELD